jgi:hypothetical protein
MASRIIEQPDAHLVRDAPLDQRRASEPQQGIPRLGLPASGNGFNEQPHAPLPRRNRGLSSKAQGKQPVPRRSGAILIEYDLLEGFAQGESGTSDILEPQPKRPRYNPDGLPWTLTMPSRPESVHSQWAVSSLRPGNSLLGQVPRSRALYGGPGNGREREGSGAIFRPNNSAPNETLHDRFLWLQQHFNGHGA